MAAPLEEILILDLTHVLAGPFGATILGDLGARIIKVERPEIGDDTRAFPPFANGMSGYFAASTTARNRLPSICAPTRTAQSSSGSLPAPM